MKIFHLCKKTSLFQRKCLKEVEKLSSMPVNAFNAFGSIYGKFSSADIFRKKYLKFCSLYFSFENLKKFPRKLHDNNILHQKKIKKKKKKKQLN